MNYNPIYNKEYRSINKERIKQRDKEYHFKNKERLNLISKEYAKKNIEKLRVARKLYKKKNIETLRVKSTLWQRNKRKSDVKFRILDSLRSRLYISLKGRCKSDTTKKLIGCDLNELLIHLKNKFDDKMNIGNYGKYWEIDHIIPCSFFDLSIVKHQQICFHYKNLQPLTVFDNRSKNDKILKPDLLQEVLNKLAA